VKVVTLTMDNNLHDSPVRFVFRHLITRSKTNVTITRNSGIWYVDMARVQVIGEKKTGRKE